MKTLTGFDRVRRMTLSNSYLIKPLLNQPYPVASYGEGIYIYDKKGNPFLDGSSGAVTASIGHGVQEVINAMYEQSKEISFVYRTQFTTNVAEKLADKMREITQGDLNWSFFVNSGSEATETAFKIAIQYWQEKGKTKKNKIISRRMSYHGITLGALAMSGHIGRRELFEDILEKYPVLSAPYYYRDGIHRTVEECDNYYVEQFENEVLRIGSENIAAFIAEPMVGAAGAVITPTKNYVKRIKALCEKYDILFIADEVMTGVGRTGKMFAMEHFDVIPDMMTTGKGMSGGYTPIASTIISDKVMEPILNGSQLIMSGHTFSANPQSAATALAVLDFIEKENLIENSANNGKYLKNSLEETMKQSNIIGDIRGKGLFIGVEFVKNKATRQPFSREVNLVNKVVNTCFQHGLIVYPANAGSSGVDGDAIIIAPPLTISKGEIDELVNKFTNSVAELENGLKEIKNE